MRYRWMETTLLRPQTTRLRTGRIQGLWEKNWEWHLLRQEKCCRMRRVEEFSRRERMERDSCPTQAVVFPRSFLKFIFVPDCFWFKISASFLSRENREAEGEKRNAICVMPLDPFPPHFLCLLPCIVSTPLGPFWVTGGSDRLTRRRCNIYAIGISSFELKQVLHD